MYYVSETSSGTSPPIRQIVKTTNLCLSDQNGVLYCLVFCDVGDVVNGRQRVVCRRIPFFSFCCRNCTRWVNMCLNVVAAICSLAPKYLLVDCTVIIEVMQDRFLRIVRIHHNMFELYQVSLRVFQCHTEYFRWRAKILTSWLYLFLAFPRFKTHPRNTWGTNPPTTVDQRMDPQPHTSLKIILSKTTLFSSMWGMSYLHFYLWLESRAPIQRRNPEPRRPTKVPKRGYSAAGAKKQWSENIEISMILPGGVWVQP